MGVLNDLFLPPFVVTYQFHSTLYSMWVLNKAQNWFRNNWQLAVLIVNGNRMIS